MIDVKDLFEALEAGDEPYVAKIIDRMTIGELKDFRAALATLRVIVSVTLINKEWKVADGN